jgi:hypothetical protein
MRIVWSWIDRPWHAAAMVSCALILVMMIGGAAMHPHAPVLRYEDPGDYIMDRISRPHDVASADAWNTSLSSEDRMLLALAFTRASAMGSSRLGIMTATAPASRDRTVIPWKPWLPTLRVLTSQPCGDEETTVNVVNLAVYLHVYDPTWGSVPYRPREWTLDQRQWIRSSLDRLEYWVQRHDAQWAIWDTIAWAYVSLGDTLAARNAFTNALHMARQIPSRDMDILRASWREAISWMMHPDASMPHEVM